MKKIKSSDELDWFDITNYRKISEWGREKIASELTARFYLRRIEESLICPHENKTFRKLFNNIRNDGEALPPEESIYANNTPMAYVMQLQLWQIESMTNNLITKLEDDPSTSYDDCHADLYGSSKFIHLAINTSGDLQIIKKELTNLIEQFKKKNSPPIEYKSYKNTDIDKIKNSGIIPISDILFWCRLHRKKISPTLIVELISPDIMVTPKQITQTIYPKIKYILEEKKMYISELRIPHS